MNSNSGIVTGLATVGTILWCVQLIPQIISNYRKKDCTGLPPLMMFLWVVSGIPFGIYFCIMNTEIIFQIQPHLFMFFCSISFFQTIYYPPVKLPKWKILAIAGSLLVVDLATELGFILWLKPVYKNGTHWPALIFGILASILLAIGLLPPYFELAKRKGRVVGINFIFLTLDSMGAYFSIASVAVGDRNVLSLILYAIVGFLELGIFVSQFIWLFRFRWFRKGHTQESVENESNDEFTTVDDQTTEEEHIFVDLEKQKYHEDTK
ncbi:similar to Saccharomyces cerevisiae YDR090C Putative protein of unknown function [Maudiozyma barnettii]|uniref:Uncharacterized protein n=1 Tax=Maudiozyma barnettii TaxID=61262 RepID=A0A8H2VD41_9SACH|nr:uncharacterized protein KABA2_02S10560 [Kazachstania barnettii]CAB4253049.1 similar to Saccharomyces cerevisiae YDR090C Putative protein of unknown function [Kazachstania barnettii]CAD1780416.1 similar to Saccharomyces cerevisiae YDR090C Putative protein of unknown function [Kazachstania barnettii]